MIRRVEDILCMASVILLGLLSVGCVVGIGIWLAYVVHGLCR